MSNDNYGSNVSRTLATQNTNYSNVVWQAGKPPLDSELNLVGQLAWENQSELMRSLTHSGFLLDPQNTESDFSFNKLWSNYFVFGSEVQPLKAVVNGWVLNIAGSDPSNEVLSLPIMLPPPPTTTSRTDFVYLEAWRVIVPEGASSVVKPADGFIFERGNVVNGQSLDDELVDPEIGFETTKRVQVQYRICVQEGVDLTTYISGFNPNTYAQGPSASPTTSAFERDTTDKGLWKAAHDGAVDGFVYAIPMGSVFRRNSTAYVLKDPTGGNQNGGINRKPSASSSDDASVLLQATLSAPLSSTYTGNVTLTNLINSGIDDPDFMSISPRILVIGDGLDKEVVAITSVTGSVITISERGRVGTQPKYHSAGSSVSVYAGRPDGKYADEVHPQDFLDMRHGIRVGEWDYQSLLVGALSDVINNNLRTTQKQNSLGTDSRGVVVEEVSLLHHTSVTNTHKMDAPNGIRTTWSDSAVSQYGITLYLDPTVATDSRGLTTSTLDSSETDFWEIAPDVQPNAFLLSGTPIQKGAAIFLSLNATEGNIAYGIKGDTNNERGLRLISPQENSSKERLYQTAPPIKIELAGSPNEYYPSETSSFETPFKVLGDVIESSNFTADTTSNMVSLYLSETAYDAVLNGGGGFNNQIQVIAFKTGVTYDSAWASTSLFDGTSTYEDLITNGGADLSGRSSSLYALVYGDPTNPDNNGAFRVISAGVVNQSNFYTDTAGALWSPANREEWIVCLAVGDTTAKTLVNNPTQSLTLDLRTDTLRDTDTEVVVAITSSVLTTDSSFYLSFAVMYAAGLGGTANVADDIHYIGVQPADTTKFLRNTPSSLDSASGEIPSLNLDELELPSKNHVSLWNQLGSRGFGTTIEYSGLTYGGVNVNNETDRESEAFYDVGSKTLVLQPYQKKGVILHSMDAEEAVIPSTYTTTGVSSDDAGIFEASKQGVFVVPQAIMPRFGRQDIPLHTRTGAGDSFLNGLNHLFADVTSTTDAVFNFVGGRDNNTVPSVYPMLFNTAGTPYGRYDSSLGSGDFALAARKVSLVVPSSDFGQTLEGIELPPFLGIARVYGVYELSNYNDYGAAAGGHDSTRINPITAVTNGDLVNLLRTDASEFTMYIHENGADEVVGSTGCHTYVLTQHAIDITRIPTWVEGNTFDQFHYVVEAVVFGFARNFINENRFVLMRKHNGNGTALTATDSIVARVSACIPFALPIGSEVGVAYSRTPYQGNVYHTQTSLTLNDDDSVIPYGRLDRNDAYVFSGSRLQGEGNINLANPKNLQVLASIDFYTTLGTGGVGGAFKPSTLMDVGNPSIISRLPDVADSSYPQTASGLFNKAPAGKKGFVTIFLFEAGHATYVSGSLTLTFVDNKRGVTHAIPYSGASLNTAVKGIQEALSTSNTFPCYVTEGVSGTSNFTALLIEAPTSDKSYEVSISLNGSAYIGQDVQLFEGIRPLPLNLKFNAYTEARVPQVLRSLSRAYFVESQPIPSVAGRGDVPLSLVGMTSRLPLGALVRDFDFLCEDILNNGSSYLGSNIGQINSNQLSIPVNEFGQPYTRVSGIVGDVLQLCDGDILAYRKWDGGSGSKNYLIARGGGSVFGVNGENPGGPLVFLVDSFSKSDSPVLKGSALACRAMLVRNGEESVNGNVVSAGDELQLLVVTYCVDGGTLGEAISLGGEISPSGYGEGFAAADRYRIKGLPLSKSHTYIGQVSATPAAYNP